MFFYNLDIYVIHILNRKFTLFEILQKKFVLFFIINPTKKQTF